MSALQASGFERGGGKFRPTFNNDNPLAKEFRLQAIIDPNSAYDDLGSALTDELESTPIDALHGFSDPSDRGDLASFFARISCFFFL